MLFLSVSSISLTRHCRSFRNQQRPSGQVMIWGCICLGNKRRGTQGLRAGVPSDVEEAFCCRRNSCRIQPLQTAEHVVIFVTAKQQFREAAIKNSLNFFMFPPMCDDEISYKFSFSHFFVVQQTTVKFWQHLSARRLQGCFPQGNNLILVTLLVWILQISYFFTWGQLYSVSVIV